ALLLGAPCAALASDPQADARALGERGLTLFQAGRWEEAYTVFAEANGLYHAPTLVLYMATCRRNQGRLVEARALYQQVMSEPLPKDAPERFKKAQAQAHEDADAVAARIPLLKVARSGPGSASARITVDGAPMSDAE